ncbi:DUF4232 domain-containing protein [Streptomyces sp. NBC_00057]|uniref:DUF4232 domain-containing protein n=1 Tax=Streptomyces sp. NBC_00057 TaxID=2975634 RepID=UPI00324A1CEE
MSTFRNRSTVLAAATTAVLALALTACGGDDSGTKSAGPAKRNSAAAGSTSESAKDTDTTTGGDTTAGGDTTSGGSTAKNTSASKGSGTAKGSTGSASAAAPVCTTKDVEITAAYQGGPPYTHIVLTAKNTSGHKCEMKGFPEIQFLESHKENVPAVAKSKPAAPIVLASGAPAYALVKVSDGGKDEDGEPVSAFSVVLQGGGGQAAVKAPGASGIFADPANAKTGYWTYELRNGADDF